MKNTQDLIDSCVTKNDHVYVPSGKVEWRLPTGILTLDKVLGGGFPAKSIVQLYGPESSGKALSVDTPIPTPNGWATIGDVKVGDVVFDGDGKQTVVTFVTPVMYNHRCYNLTFSDGSSIIADAEHIWNVRSYHSPRGCLYGRFGNRHNSDKLSEFANQYQVTTEEMLKNVVGRVYKNGSILYNYRVDLHSGIELQDIKLPVPPYTLGVWLGDGNSDSARITLGDEDSDGIINNIINEGVPVKRCKNNKRTPQYCLTNGDKTQKSRDISVQAKLRQLNLIENKHIPWAYLRSSIQQRLQLLRGLMDTDGSVSKEGRCEITSTNLILANNICELISSLGYKVSLISSCAKLNGRITSNNYRLNFISSKDKPVVTVSKKVDRLINNGIRRLTINNIQEVDSVPVKCIQVDSPTHLYLVGKNMIPTHNTTLAYRVVAQALNLGYSTLLIPIEPYSEEYAEMCGIDIYSDKFHIVAADFAEEVFNLCIEAIRNYDTMVIVMDSISMATPKADLEKKQKTSDLDKGYNIGSQARAISDFIRKIKQPIVRKQAIFVTVNQLSYQIGKWGGIKKPKGGEALQYASDIKLNMWGRVNKVTQDIQVNITVDKCKVWEGTPFGSVTLNLEHAKGFDIEADIVLACEKAGIISKRASWYVYGDKKFQGLEKFSDALREDNNLKDELFEKATKANIEIEKNIPIDYMDEEDGKEDVSEKDTKEVDYES